MQLWVGGVVMPSLRRPFGRFKMPYDGLQFQLSETPGKLTRAQAMVGEDNKEILTEILSMGSLEVQTLLNEGVLEQSF